MAAFPCPGPCCGQTLRPGVLCIWCQVLYGDPPPRPQVPVDAVVDRAACGRRPTFTVEQKAAIVVAYEGGTGLAPIAVQHGVSTPTIRRLLANNGVTIRPRPGWAVA